MSDSKTQPVDILSLIATSQRLVERIETAGQQLEQAIAEAQSQITTALNAAVQALEAEKQEVIARFRDKVF